VFKIISLNKSTKNLRNTYILSQDYMRGKSCLSYTPLMSFLQNSHLAKTALNHVPFHARHACKNQCMELELC
jgi:hypothetical protein